jgi:hypothetical protein
MLALDVLIFDPLVAVHTLAEADNTSLAKILRALSMYIARPCDCAVELVHHTRKAGKGDDSALVPDDMRGAGTIVYTPRSGRLMHQMSMAEAEKYGISGEDDRFAYVRLERAKPNMAKRGSIYWIKLVVHDVGNAGDGEESDTVTVPALWTPVDVADKVTDTIAVAVRAEIAKGDWKRDSRAGNSWAGRVVGKLCHLDLSKRSGRTQAESILGTLISRGILTTEFRTDKNHNSREFVIPAQL